jgi:hypothetical protein
MTRRLSLLLTICLLTITPAFAQYTASGHTMTSGGNPAQTTSFVRFRLDNYGANIPRVLGTGALVNDPPDVTSNPGTGLYSQTLYANDQITPAGTQWIVEYWYNGQMQSTAAFTLTAASAPWNLDSLAPNTTTPVVPAGTGDGTYGRIDGGNSFTGLIQFAGGLTGKTLNGVANASFYTGADIGAKVNSALTALGNVGTVFIPSGTYTFSTNINMPVGSNGQAELICSSGARLNFTGTGYAIQAVTTGVAPNNANVRIVNCEIVGTSAGSGGVKLHVLNGAVLDHVTVRGFSSGNGVLVQGANQVDLIAPRLISNAVGLHDIGVVYNALPYAANAVSIHGGYISYNTSYGWYEDATVAGSAGYNLNNHAFGTTLEGNTGANVFWQGGHTLGCHGCYMEMPTGATTTNPFQIGDATWNVTNPIVENSFFSSIGASNSITMVQSAYGRVTGNEEIQTITTFLNLGSDTAKVFGTEIGLNKSQATNYISGSVSTTTTIRKPDGTITAGAGFTGIASGNIPTTALSTDGTLAGNSDTLVPSQKAVKTYADTKAPLNAPTFTGSPDVTQALAMKFGANVGLSYIGTGQLGLGNGTPGNTAGDLFLRNVTATDGIRINTTTGCVKLFNGSAYASIICLANPTIGSGFGTSPTILATAGTAAFQVTVGTGGVATSGVVTMPTAINGWNCSCNDITTYSTTVFACRQTASTTTSVTIGNFNSSAVAAAWAASDVLRLQCTGY